MNAKFISLEDFANKAKQEEKFTLLELTRWAITMVIGTNTNFNSMIWKKI